MCFHAFERKVVLKVAKHVISRHTQAKHDSKRAHSGYQMLQKCPKSHGFLACRLTMALKVSTNMLFPGI